MEYNKMKSGTCLAVIRDKEGNLWFGSDRRATWNFGKAMVLESPKSRFRNNILMMGTGSCFIAVEILDHLKFPVFKFNQDPEKFIHNKFVPAIINHFNRLGMMHKTERRLNTKEENHEWHGAIMVVGVGSLVFEVNVDNENINYNRVTAPWAHGCGGALAWGSLLTTEDSGMSPEERLKTALKVAAYISVGCDDNIDIITNKEQWLHKN